jgi:hypothetical protein
MISEIFYIQNFISEDLIEKLMSWTHDTPPIKDNYSGNPFEFLQPNGDPIVCDIFSFLNKSIQENIEQKFSCKIFEETLNGMTVYAPGSFLPEHIDNVPGQNIPTPNGYPSRDISSTLYYNEDYKGGEIFFVNQDLKIKPTAGSLLLFPSNEKYIHEVLPVISGIRYSSTNFWCVKEYVN